MGIRTAVEIIHGKGEDAVDQETKDKLRARLVGMMDDSGVEGETRADALRSLDALLAGPAGASLDKLSGESIAKSMEKAAESLEPLDSGLIALGFSYSQRGHGRQSFEVGEARGALSSARLLLSFAATNLRHAAGCDCQKDTTEDAERPTEPPPEAAA